MVGDFLGVIHIGISPVVVQLGPVAVHWYGVLYAVAFAAGFRWAALPYLAKHGVGTRECERLAIWTILGGLVGGRLYYVVQQPDLVSYLGHPIRIIAVWEGGMDAFGGIFGALVTLLVLARSGRWNFWLLLDAAALFAVVAQPIGRIGNVINGDILGGPSNLPWATAYDNPHAVLQSGYHLGVAYQPAGFYEGVCAAAIGVVLGQLVRRRVPIGVVGMVYFGLYAGTQFFMFYVRQTEPVVAFGLKQSQWTCLAMLAVGMPLMVAAWRRDSRHPERHVAPVTASGRVGAVEHVSGD